MEGPQSDFDVQNYKSMAGDVGNPNIPIQTRLKILDQIEELQGKYKEIQSGESKMNQYKRGEFRVTAPNGKTYKFNTQEDADRFKRQLEQ